MCGSHCDPCIPSSPQSQSPFFTRLPAEIRNKIYTHVFTRNTSIFTKHQVPRPPHQLCLLSTCKRAHSEAHILAFKTYTFPLHTCMSPTYTGLCDVTAHLPAPHKRAITSLSVLSGSNPSGFLTNALLAFPSLRYFVVQTGGVYQADARTGKCRTSHASSGLTYPVGACDEATIQEPANRAVARYAPHALTSLLAAVASGKAYRWQTGEKWWVEWPQLESSCMYAHVRHDGDEDMVMDGGAVGEVNDVDMCVCECGDVSWTGADLVQEGGRRVHVRIVYCRRADEYAYGESVNEYHKVRLIPGTTPAAGVVAERAGFRYEPDAEYWEEMRRKNGDLGAFCRGLWKRAMAFENESYSKLTTRK